MLVDAHALLWWLADSEKLSSGARRAIERSPAPLLGTGTALEIAVKASLGKLPIGADWRERVQADGFGLLAIDWRHLARLQELGYPNVGGSVHRDPFDRLLVAQSLSDGIPVVTRDPAFAAYGVTTLW
jgi:PIN domain nuclease of toxin-antitoxin system